MTQLTDRAADRIRKRTQGRPGACLRLRVEAGGCAGLSYAFGFDEGLRRGDSVVEKDGARLAVDRMSRYFVRGATVDWHEDLQRSEFRVHNPDAAATCMCGSSFEAPGTMPASLDAKGCGERRPLETLTGT